MELFYSLYVTRTVVVSKLGLCYTKWTLCCWLCQFFPKYSEVSWLPGLLWRFINVFSRHQFSPVRCHWKDELLFMECNLIPHLVKFIFPISFEEIFACCISRWVTVLSMSHREAIPEPLFTQKISDGLLFVDARWLLELEAHQEMTCCTVAQNKSGAFSFLRRKQWCPHLLIWPQPNERQLLCSGWGLSAECGGVNTETERLQASWCPVWFGKSIDFWLLGRTALLQEAQSPLPPKKGDTLQWLREIQVSLNSLFLLHGRFCTHKTSGHECFASARTKSPPPPIFTSVFLRKPPGGGRFSWEKASCKEEK